MNEGLGDTRISLRLADGEFFPVFRHGDPDTRNLSLVPASHGQDEADLHFYFHPSDGSRPIEIGTMKFRDLPADADDLELRLDAVAGPTGLLSVAVSHVDSGRTERLEMDLPEDGSSPGPARKKAGTWKNGPLKWVFGALFVLACLTALFFLTRAVADWGNQEPGEPPVSVLVNPIEAV